MKKLLLALTLAFLPVSAFAQCNGVFPALSVCGSVGGGIPTAIPSGNFGFVTGPGSSVVGHFALWNNTSGTLLSDAGTAIVITSNGSLVLNGATDIGIAGSVYSANSVNSALEYRLTNVNAGTAAFSQFSAFNANGNAGFGVGGANETSTVALANKAYVFGSSPLGGISIYNAGANPIDFYTNGSRVGGFTGAGAFQVGTGTLAIAAGKTLTVSNTLTFTGTDGSSVNFGTGGTVLYSGGSGFAASVSNSDGTLTISPTTGAVVASLALGHANTWTALQTFNSGDLAATSPAFAGTSTGTYTLGGTITINAFTLGGTISGGGNQINNIIIGNSTPLAGSFTTVSASTSLTSPLRIGGSGTTGTQAELRNTSGVGTTDTMIFTGGNNGGTRIATFLGTGKVGVGSSVGAQTPTNVTMVISNNVTAVDATTPLSIVPVIQAVGADGVGGGFVSDSFGATPSLGFRAAAGTAASPTVVTSGAFLGAFFGFGYDGSAGKWGLGGQISFNAAETFSATAHGTKIEFFTVPTTTTTITNAMTLQASGGLSIGTTTDPGLGSLQINAQIFMPNITTSSAAQNGTVCWTTGTGKFTVDTTVGCLTSRMTAKDITTRLSSARALEIVDKLSPFAFRYKKGEGDSGQYEQFGLGAEEVALVDERLAGRDSHGTLQGVRYQELTAVLAGAIKELKADNDNLRSEIEIIRKRVQ